MARSKYLNLKEARKMKRLDRFAKEHPSASSTCKSITCKSYSTRLHKSSVHPHPALPRQGGGREVGVPPLAGGCLG